MTHSFNLVAEKGKNAEDTKMFSKEDLVKTEDSNHILRPIVLSVGTCDSVNSAHRWNRLSYRNYKLR
jgi:hypothetical protein